jgi:hypothetical protein
MVEGVLLKEEVDVGTAPLLAKCVFEQVVYPTRRENDAPGGI